MSASEKCVVDEQVKSISTIASITHGAISNVDTTRKDKVLVDTVVPAAKSVAIDKIPSSATTKSSDTAVIQSPGVGDSLNLKINTSVAAASAGSVTVKKSIAYEEMSNSLQSAISTQPLTTDLKVAATDLWHLKKSLL